MRRELSLVGMSLVAYACALVLGSLIICVEMRERAHEQHQAQSVSDRCTRAEQAAAVNT